MPLRHPDQLIMDADTADPSPSLDPAAGDGLAPQEVPATPPPSLSPAYPFSSGMGGQPSPPPSLVGGMTGATAARPDRRHHLSPTPSNTNSLATPRACWHSG